MFTVLKGDSKVRIEKMNSFCVALPTRQIHLTGSDTAHVGKALYDMFRMCDHRGPDITWIKPMAALGIRLADDLCILTNSSGDLLVFIISPCKIQESLQKRIVKMVEGEVDVAEVCKTLGGQCGLLVVDTRVDKKRWYICRDALGLVPLYFGWQAHTSFILVSTSDISIVPFVEAVKEVPCGYYLSNVNNEVPKQWYTTMYYPMKNISEAEKPTKEEVMQEFQAAVNSCQVDSQTAVIIDASNSSNLLYTMLSSRLQLPTCSIVHNITDENHTQGNHFTFTTVEGVNCMIDVMHCTNIINLDDLIRLVPFWILFKKLNIRKFRKVLIAKTDIREVIAITKIAALFNIKIMFPFLQIKLNEFLLCHDMTFASAISMLSVTKSLTSPNTSNIPSYETWKPQAHELLKKNSDKTALECLLERGETHLKSLERVLNNSKLESGPNCQVS